MTRLAPVLAPVTLDGEEYEGKKLKGIRAKCAVTVLKDGKPAANERGEVQFTEDGISGIAVFNLSRFLKLEDGEMPEEGMRRYCISLDFVPDYEENYIEKLLREKQKSSDDGDLLRTIIDDRLAETVLKKATEEACMKSQDKHTGYDIIYAQAAARTLKNLTYKVTGTAGWKAAQCTSGGVPMWEIYEKTCESKLQPGLYFVGEILDYDGPCGGFNLQNAWTTGIKAGLNAARALG
ncbi:MAG: hypothetical protein HFG67_05820 [Firmicutes bacterium]|nr:hypothetical protein [Bacillota bacterium]